MPSRQERAAPAVVALRRSYAKDIEPWGIVNTSHNGRTIRFLGHKSRWRASPEAPEKKAEADPLEIVARSASPAFATDERKRIVSWNGAAERLLGRPAAGVLGRPCYAILRGQDLFGNRFCDEHCSLDNMARRRESPRHFEMAVLNGSGEAIWVGCSIVVVPRSAPSKYVIVHFLQPLDCRSEVDRLLRRLLVGSPAPHTASLPSGGSCPSRPVPLTAREREVLRLLADGAGTRAIADSLFISFTTARNHIQNVLRKLGVHSRLEAVTLAFRDHLV